MKLTMVTLISTALIVACCPPQKAENKKATAASGAAADITKESLKTDRDKINYAIGVEIGKNIVRNGLDYKKDVFLKGIDDGMADDKFLMTEEERGEIKRTHAKEQRELRQKKREEEAKKNKEDGEKFLAENKTKEGIVTLESGLQYKILKEGTGEKPASDATVSVNYTGTLIDGTEFDSSVKRGKPAQFRVDRVVKGWTEALQLMPIGSKWKLFIPSELGYGERGSHGKIGPNAVLIFEVELLEIVKKDEPKPGAAPAGQKPTTKAKPAEAKKETKPAAKPEEKK